MPRWRFSEIQSGTCDGQVYWRLLKCMIIITRFFFVLDHKIINFLSLFFSCLIGDNETFCFQTFCTHLLQFSLLCINRMLQLFMLEFCMVKDTACTFPTIFLPIHISIWWPLLLRKIQKLSSVQRHNFGHEWKQSSAIFLLLKNSWEIFMPSRLNYWSTQTFKLWHFDTQKLRHESPTLLTFDWPRF